MDIDFQYKAHFIDEGERDDAVVFAKKVISQVPRVDDTLRFSNERYFKVTRVIWIYDEPEAHYQRVNIGIVPD